MRTEAIRFETYAPARPPDPARMDVTGFIGLVAERAGLVLPPDLTRSLTQMFGLRPDELTAPGQLLNRPVPVPPLQTQTVQRSTCWYLPFGRHSR